MYVFVYNIILCGLKWQPDRYLVLGIHEMAMLGIRTTGKHVNFSTD